MRCKILFVIVVFLGYGLFADEKVRPYWNEVGFCKTHQQIEKVVDLSLKREQNLLEKEKDLLRNKTVVMAMSPHDEHLYTGPSLIHSVPHIAQVKTIIIIGKAYADPSLALKNTKSRLVFDDFDAWAAPYSPIKVDVELRTFLKEQLDKNIYIESRVLHTLEQSIESQLAFLKFYNREILILPILITDMDFDTIYKMSENFSDVIVSYLKKHHLKLGQDLAFLVTTDLIHYITGYFNNPFAFGDAGIDEEAHIEGVDQDIKFGRKFFSDTISEDKIRDFKVLNVNWIGADALVFGLLTTKKVLKEVDNRSLKGCPLKYSNSYSEGALPAYQLGIGVSNPISLQHWVGYWSMVFYGE